uniref:Target of rapamycin complex 2 subunit MAPKAP1 n=4 Tax=Parascaris univalens TaxID=6257 RepID=A0A915AM87_PARUN
MRNIYRRAKPGGLPLGFRQEDSHESDGEQYSPGYVAYFDEQSTRGIIDTRLRSKTNESDISSAAKAGISCSNIIVPGDFSDSAEMKSPYSDLIKYRNPSEVNNDFISRTSRLLKASPQTTVQTLAVYAKFESADVASARELLVFYPFADTRKDERHGCALRIRVQPQIRVSDLIGVCCYAYMRNSRTPPISDPSYYRLLMAEENGEVDRDLPPVDGHRCLSELGSCWSTVALVHRSEVASSASVNKVVVYTIGGGRYVFELDSLDVTLGWLRDRALERRIEEEGDSFMCSSEYPELREYLLETVNESEKPLNLEMTVASTACTEFLMLRKNSSRGDFQVPLSRPGTVSENDAPAAVINRVSVSVDRPALKLDFFRRSTGSKDTVSLSPTLTSPSDFIELGALVGEYSVDRVHRYKPRWSARFALHSLGFELTRCQLERRRTSGLFTSNSPKYLKVLWDYVGGADITDHLTAKRVVRITWLPLPDSMRRNVEAGYNAVKSGSVSSGTGSVGSYRSESFITRSAAQAYEGTHWKTLQLEADTDDAWEIAQKVNDILEGRKSRIRSLYLHSAGGKKKPALAAEIVAASEKIANKYATLPGERNSTANVGARRISRFASTFANAVPTLQRKLNRQPD